MKSPLTGQALRGVLSSATRFMQTQKPLSTPWKTSVAGIRGNAATESYADGRLTKDDGASGAQAAGGVTDSEPLRFAVVGSGPAGFYTADRVSGREGPQSILFLRLLIVGSSQLHRMGTQSFLMVDLVSVVPLVFVTLV